MLSGLVLAAGSSTRMGSPKQLLPLDGRSMLQHVVDRLAAESLDEIVVVLGHARQQIEGVLQLPSRARVLFNPSFASGQASSLRAGLDAMSENVRATLVLLGDQPDIPSEAIREVRRVYAKTGGPVVRAVYRGQPGHPVLLDRSVWSHVTHPSGDRGAGATLERHPEWVRIAAIDRSPPLEANTPDDFRSLLESRAECT